jgi:hypothetical protein
LNNGKGVGAWYNGPIFGLLKSFYGVFAILMTIFDKYFLFIGI